MGEYHLSHSGLLIYFLASYFFGYGMIYFLLFVSNNYHFNFDTFMRFMLIPILLSIISIVTNNFKQKKAFSEFIIGGLWMAWTIWHFFDGAFHMETKNFALFVDWLFLVIQSVFGVVLGLGHFYQGILANKGVEGKNRFKYKFREALGLFLMLILASFGMGYIEQVMILKDHRFDFHKVVMLLYGVSDLLLILFAAAKAWMGMFVCALVFEFSIIYLLAVQSSFTFSYFVLFCIGIVGSGLNLYNAYQLQQSGKKSSGQYNLLNK